MNRHTAILTKRIRTLSPVQIVEVEHFVEFLRLRGQERELARAAASVSTPAFDAIWANPDDDAYDAL